VFFDDFEDAKFTERSWQGASAWDGALRLSETFTRSVYLPISASYGDIQLSFKDRYDDFTVNLSGLALTFRDGSIGTWQTTLPAVIPAAADLTVRMLEGKAVVTINGTTFEIYDWTAHPFVYSGSSTSIAFSVNRGAIVLDDVKIDVP
jgi:hypothetical protein